MPLHSERIPLVSAWYGGPRLRRPAEGLDGLDAILLEPQPRASWEAEEESRSREPSGASSRGATRAPFVVGTAASIAGAAAGAMVAGPIGAAVGSKGGAALGVVAGASFGAVTGPRLATHLNNAREVQLQELQPSGVEDADVDRPDRQARSSPFLSLHSMVGQTLDRASAWRGSRLKERRPQAASER
jgi:hypothetical protein